MEFEREGDRPRSNIRQTTIQTISTVLVREPWNANKLMFTIVTSSRRKSQNVFSCVYNPLHPIESRDLFGGGTSQGCTKIDHIISTKTRIVSNPFIFPTYANNLGNPGAWPT